MSEDRPTIHSHRSDTNASHRRMNKVAVTLLCYPIVYIFLTMPLSITRLSQFAGNNWDLSVIHAAAGIFCCSGFVNVLLYTLTRKGIISWDWMFRRKRQTSPTTPTFNGHYPGAQPSPKGPKPKHSALSIHSANGSQANSIKSNIESDNESAFEYGRSDNDKLVHQSGCPQRYLQERARGSNASTLLGTCSCMGSPRSPGSH
jgi:hypothetical protein